MVERAHRVANLERRHVDTVENLTARMREEARRGHGRNRFCFKSNTSIPPRNQGAKRKGIDRSRGERALRSPAQLSREQGVRSRDGRYLRRDRADLAYHPARYRSHRLQSV